MIFINGSENKFCEIAFKVYLIKTDNKLILVDAGCENYKNLRTFKRFMHC